MSSILTFLAAAFTRIFADKVIGWIAIKTVLGFLFITIVPLILNNFIYDLIEIVIGFSSNGSVDSAAAFGCTVQYDAQGNPFFDCSKTFTGVLAYFMTVFAVPESLSVLFSALSVRVALKMIPFVRL